MTITELIVLEGNKPIYASQLNENFNLLDDKIGAAQTSIGNITPSSIGALATTGGTINGALTTTGNITVSKSGPQLILKNTAQTAGTPPQSSAAERIYFQDSADTTLGQVANVYSSDGSRYSTLTSANGNGSASTYIRVGFDADGNEYFSFPKCTTAAGSSSTASSGKVAVIVKNYRSGFSWYRKWSDGWIEQGSKKNRSASETPVSFIVDFVNTPTILMGEYETGGAHATVSCITEASNTGFKWSSASGVDAMYWYACGY